MQLLQILIDCFYFHSTMVIMILQDIQANTSIPQQLEENDGAAMFFFAEKHQKTIINFSLDSLVVSELHNL